MKKFLLPLMVVALVGFTGCSDESNDPGNLLSDPGNTKDNSTSYVVLGPRLLGEDVGELRWIEGKLDGPVGGRTHKGASDEIQSEQRFHEIIPEYSLYTYMCHDGLETCYMEEGSNEKWWHIADGPWASYYSTDPTGCPDGGEPFHEFIGPEPTSMHDMWHIPGGELPSYYYDPMEGSVWCHDPSGEYPSSYIPMDAVHITDPTDATDADGNPIDDAEVTPTSYVWGGQPVNPELLPEGFLDGINK